MSPDTCSPAARRFSRREFLKITAIAGSLAGLGAVGSTFLPTTNQPTRVHAQRLLLGTVANLTVIAEDPDTAQNALDAAFARMAELEDVMSRFRPHSQLSQLNAAQRLDHPHPALCAVLERACYFGDLTGGAFDVTIEPVLRCYRAAARYAQLPAADDIEQARALVNYRDLSIAPDAVLLRRAGMAITLDGIAKGYIIDQGADEFRQRGFTHVLVELGGDMQAIGSVGERPWHIALQPPRADFAALPPVELTNRALATSGDYMQAYTPDFEAHHIVNPATGESPHTLSSASILAPTACDADALATAVMTLGPKHGLALLQQLPQVKGILITKTGEALYSESDL